MLWTSICSRFDLEQIRGNRVMKLKGKRIAILAEDLYQEMEIWYPLYRMREEGAEVQVIGSGRIDTFKGKSGYPIRADYAVGQVRAQDFDAIIIPGGYAPDLMRRYPPMIQFVREAASEGKLIAVICHGLWVPISAGILKGKRATGFFSIKDDIVNAGAEYVDEEVVRDGLLITSRVPDDLPAFCRAIIEALSEPK